MGKQGDDDKIKSDYLKDKADALINQMETLEKPDDQ